MESSGHLLPVKIKVFMQYTVMELIRRPDFGLQSDYALTLKFRAKEQEIFVIRDI